MDIERVYGSSSIEEIKQRQAQMEYRKLWLKALHDENQLELESLLQIKEDAVTEIQQANSLTKLIGFFKGNKSQNKIEEIPEGNHKKPKLTQGSMLEFIDDMSRFALELNLSFTTPDEIKQRQETLNNRQAWLQKLLKTTEKELNLISTAEEQKANEDVKEISETSDTVLKMIDSKF
ncbi:hypothetical protein [Fischerella thermalis]|nr:hypothetical protein [Fischerella thermalis]PLZ43883.1 hypothetical protein CBP25_11480 [Fischerella thermalis WC527]PLZ82190.1 hypothetical protein CBP16_07760 [Fischerella thermalis WC217]PLZ04779.1 hypothetical protein CBP19_23035 [Fischerella thermalis WC1110]PLZ10868.1 hypothetical protein CBP18_09980 [Fischerella thermalis WC119]PLZ23389.1 hypothetical protein CBP29_12480 [Fischerella thermalis WC341]